MTTRFAVVMCLVWAAVARADTPVPGPDDTRIPPELRRAYEEGDFETVRRELLKEYELRPRPELLFALGQVEYNLANYEAAISYYEKFIATNPTERQMALAQQGLGAAMARLAEQEKAKQDKAAQDAKRETPLPPPPPPEVDTPRVSRQWYAQDTGLVALGGAAVAVGGGLLYYSHRLGSDHRGSLATYDRRAKQARTTMWTGVGVAAAGAAVIGVTLLRWRLRPDGSDLSASIAPGSATLVFTGRW